MDMSIVKELLRVANEINQSDEAIDARDARAEEFDKFPDDHPVWEWIRQHCSIEGITLLIVDVFICRGMRFWEQEPPDKDCPNCVHRDRIVEEGDGGETWCPMQRLCCFDPQEEE